jgi:hypothetical protein
MTHTHTITLPDHLNRVWVENHISNMICREIDQEILNKIKPDGYKLPDLTSMQEWLNPCMLDWCAQVDITMNIFVDDHQNIILEFDSKDWATMFALRWF